MDGYDKRFRKNRSLFSMSLEIHDNGNLRMSVTVNVRVYVYEASASYFLTSALIWSVQLDRNFYRHETAEVKMCFLAVFDR